METWYSVKDKRFRYLSDAATFAKDTAKRLNQNVEVKRYFETTNWGSHNYRNDVYSPSGRLEVKLPCQT